MNLIGEYTQAGAALATKIQAGQADLRITRAAGGQGQTPASATAMNDERQALGLGLYTLNGPTLSVPAKLLSVEAESPYMLSEIGLYALDSSDTEILYKIYRLEPSISVSPVCALTATFYLNDTVVAGSAVSVTVSPTGLLTLDDIDLVLGALGDMDTETALDLSCEAEQLQSLLDSLPRRVPCNIKITVTGGTVPGNLRIQGFFGMGKLMVVAAEQTPIDGYVEIQYNTLSRVVLDGFTTHPDKLAPISGNNLTGASVVVRSCGGTVGLKRVVAGEPAVRNQVGFFVENSHCILHQITVKSREVGVLVSQGGKVMCRSFINNTSQNNTRTVRSIQGGIGYLPYTMDVLSNMTGGILLEARGGFLFLATYQYYYDDGYDDGN